MQRIPGTTLLATLLLVLSAACGGDSASVPPPTPSLTAQPAAPTQPPPEASATLPAVATSAAPAPTVTSSPTPEATPTASSDMAPSGFQFEGSPEFVEWTQEALELLRSSAPEWYQQVAASIATFRSVPEGSGMNVFEKVYLVGEVTAYAPGFPRDQQRIWYAGTIVHDSCHSDRFDEGLVYQGREGEVACLMDQKAALLLLDTGTYFVDYIQSLIDGADDPSNAYWANPNRHW